MGQVTSTARRRMTEAEIRSIVDKLANIARVLNDADPNDKSEIFRQLGLKLTYHPGRGIVEAQVQPAVCGFFDGVRGGLEPGNR
jgi:site-specific DNA recombinase